MSLSKMEMAFFLRHLYLDELIPIADTLSEDRKKFTYDKRKKSIIAKALVTNVERDDIIQALSEISKKEEDFPRVLQTGKIVFGLSFG